MFKIAITGPESSGKTTLARSLAKHFDCPLILEYAREYLNEKGNEYEQEDLVSILKGQLKNEEKAGIGNPSYLICDSDPLIIKIWSQVRFGNVDLEIESAWKNQHYDLHLLLYPDIDWEYDPLRENKDDRLLLFDRYHEALKLSQRPFFIINGKEDERFKKAIIAINKYSSKH